MNYRVTLGLLAVLVLLFGGVYWSELRPQPAPTPTPTGSKVMTFNVADVADLDISWSGKQVTVHKGNDGQWQLTRPEAAAAAEASVDGALDALSTLNASRDLAVKQEELGNYGLAQPQAVITVTMGSGANQKLIVGSANPNNTAYYVRRPTTDGEVTVYVAPSSVVEQLKGLVDNPPKAPPTPAPLPATPMPAAPEAAPSPSATP